MEEEYSLPSVPTQRKNNKNNRRFSDEQIKSLESIFKTETKLEPRKKMQLARDLGLQPRQVAIWFQNRRARWKSKQIEQEYRVLKANYDNLNSQFESLKMEKHSLLIQLQKLSDLLKHHHDEGKEKEDSGRKTTVAGGSNSGDTISEFEENRGCSNEELEKVFRIHLDDDGHSENDYDERGRIRYVSHGKGSELLNLSRKAEEEDDGAGSLAPGVKKWSGFESKPVFTESSSCDASNWWEFWT